VNAGGLTVEFDKPSATGGQSPVTVTCSPGSGENFPIGTTAVTCKATDALNRTAECAFPVTVAKLAQLSKVRYLAFGDSVTSGEVSFPIGSTSLHGLGGITKQVVVPSAAYPTILAKTLQGRYPSQAEQIVVANYGLGGERTVDARNRYFQALSIVRPEVVLLMEGYNDIGGGANGAASSAASEVDIMAAEARARGMRVFLATALPPRPGGNRAIDLIYIIDWNNRMATVASRQGATLVDLYNAILPEVNRYIGVDGLHPNEAGYAKIADVFFQAIQASLEVR
jgi:lysophospholipase L1-like esterase